MRELIAISKAANGFIIDVKHYESEYDYKTVSNVFYTWEEILGFLDKFDDCSFEVKNSNEQS